MYCIMFRGIVLGRPSGGSATVQFSLLLHRGVLPYTDRDKVSEQPEPSF